MSGYLIGLSSPSVTESTTTLQSSPKSKADGTNKVADVFNKENGIGFGFDLPASLFDHIGVKVTAFPGVDLNGTATGCANTFGVVQGLLITFDHSKFVLVFDLVDRIAEQCGLTASGTGNKI